MFPKKLGQQQQKTGSLLSNQETPVWNIPQVKGKKGYVDMKGTLTSRDGQDLPVCENLHGQIVQQYKQLKLFILQLQQNQRFQCM